MRKNGYSQAFRDFGENHRRPAMLLKIEIANYKHPPNLIDQIAVSALRDGTTILLVACIEQYLKSALEEYVDEIAKKAIYTTHRKLPKGFDALNDFKYMQSTIQGRLPKQAKILEVRRISTLVASSRFVPESFSRTQSNPGPTTVKALLNDFGILDPLAAIEGKLTKHYTKPFGTGFILSQLDNLVTARNQVAHGVSSLNKSRSDIRAWVEFAYGFIKATDNVIRDKTLTIISDLN